jgi:hypothetical protein
VVSAVALLMTTMLFKEGPLLVVAASPGLQHDTSVPTPPTSHKNSNVRSSVKAAAAGGRKLLRGDAPSGPRDNPLLVLASPQPNPNVLTPHNPLLVLASPQPNPNVPTPPEQRPVQSSAAVRHVGCSPRPSCEPNVPTPGCCSPKSKKEQEVKFNGKAGNYQNSINDGKHASADQINIAVRRGLFHDSLPVNTEPIKSTRKLIAS